MKTFVGLGTGPVRCEHLGIEVVPYGLSPADVTVEGVKTLAAGFDGALVQGHKIPVELLKRLLDAFPFVGVIYDFGVRIYRKEMGAILDSTREFEE